MSTAGRARLGRAIAGLSVVLATAGTATLVALGRGDVMLRDFAAHHAVAAAGFGAASWVVFRRQPRNATVWVLAVAAGFNAVYVAGMAFAYVAAGNPSLGEISDRTPAELPGAVRLALPIFGAATVPGVGLVVTLSLLLFPDGRFPTPVARAVGWVSVACIGALTAAAIWSLLPSSSIPIGAAPSEYTGPARLFDPLTVVLVGAAVCAVALLTRRFASSTGEVRQQYGWILLGTAALVAGLVASLLLGPGVAYSTAGSILELVGCVAVVAAFGVALTKYRLWDFDLVVSRVLVFTTLAVFITAIYALVAVVIGGRVGGSRLTLSVLATALVAVCFEPARNRVQRWAHRVVYGTRATPFEVLSAVTGTLATTELDEGVLARMTSMLRAGTGAERAAVWLVNGGGFMATAASPPEAPSVAADVTALPGSVQLIEHDGELLGALTVEKSRTDLLTPAERSLMADLAGPAALVLRRLRLDAELQAAARDLERSRRRLITIEDVERRRLERDLHDGVEQRLRAVMRALTEAGDLAEAEGAPRTVCQVEQLVDDARRAVEQIRALGQGLSPPLLEAEGLAAALRALVASSPSAVRVDANVRRRHPPELEGAIYFCVSEALTNAAKHGRGPVVVEATDHGGELAFSVRDAGPGFEPRTTTPGSGLRNMADRLDALGGRLVVASGPGQPTTVTGCLPIVAVTSPSMS